MCSNLIDVTDGVALRFDIGRKSKVLYVPSGKLMSDSIDISRSARADGLFDALQAEP